VGDAEDDVTSLLREADALIDVGRLDDGIARASEAARRAPQNATAYQVWARGLLEDGQLTEAAEIAGEAIRLEPQHAVNYRIRSAAMGQAAAKMSGSARSQAAFESRTDARTAVRLEPWEPNGHLVLASALSLTKDFTGADEELQIAIRTAPNSVSTWVTASAIAIRAENWDAAISACHRALALDANSYPALNNLGVALRETGRGWQGNEALARAAAVNPDGTTARRNLSREGIRYARMAVLIVLIPVSFLVHFGFLLYMAFAIISNVVISRRPDLVLRAERWAAPLALYFTRRSKARHASAPDPPLDNLLPSESTRWRRRRR
jgi:tetratricopeptide (TPR) repeat protein